MSSQPSSASPLDSHTSPVRSTTRRSGRAIAALIIGIIAVIAVLIPIAAWILGVIAIVLGATARADIRRNGCLGAGQAKTAIILGALAIVGGLAFFAIVLSNSN